MQSEFRHRIATSPIARGAAVSLPTMMRYDARLIKDRPGCRAGGRQPDHGLFIRVGAVESAPKDLRAGR